MSLHKFEFRPLSFASWCVLFKQTGLLGVAIILASLSSKFFDLRDHETVLSGAFSGAMAFRAICIGGALFILLGYLGRFRIFNTYSFKLLLLYSLIGVFSTTWSFTPIASFGKSIELLIGLLVIVAAASQENGKEKLLSFFNLLIYVIFFQLLVVFIGYLSHTESFFEKTAGGLASIVSMRMTSPIMSANSIGYNSLLLLVVLLNSCPRGFKINRKNGCYGLFLLLTLILSTSRTSIGILIFAITILIFYEDRKIFLLITIPLLLLLLMEFNNFTTELFRVIKGNQAAHITMTLSGRTMMWTAALDLVKEHPLLGVGFGIGSRVTFYLAHNAFGGSTLSTVHNGFLEVLIGIGLLGFVPWFLAIGSGILCCMKKYKGKGQIDSVYYGIWPVFLGATIMSVGLGGVSNEIFLLFAIVVALIDMDDNNIEDRYFKVSW